MFIHGDGHVHIYREFDLPSLFGVAADRARRLQAPLLLLLAEVASHDYYGWLSRVAAHDPRAEDVSGSANPTARLCDAFWLRPTAEAQSLAFGVRGQVPASGYLIAGRQIVSVEGIEVLGVGASDPDALSRLGDRELAADELVRRVRAAGAIAVLAWGLGKWSGSRGERIGTLASDPEFSQDRLFLLGDSAHRFWPWPLAHRSSRVRVLAGTDPLPLPGAEARIGSYGFRLAGTLDPEAPLRSLTQGLRAADRIESFGRPAAFPAVLSDQVRYRLRSRTRGQAVGD